MDTTQVQFVVQNFYYQFIQMTEDGESLWKKINMDKNRVIWLNPNNGFSIAAPGNLEYEIKLPSS